MGLISIFSVFGHAKEDVLDWKDREAIYDSITSHLASERSLNDGNYSLPDEHLLERDGEPTWASGALDGVMTHHVGSGKNRRKARGIINLVAKLARTGRTVDQAQLYQKLLAGDLLEVLDDVLYGIANQKLDYQPHLLNFAEKLAFESPDRTPVKFGIALLGVIGKSESLKKIEVLGQHEEFTLFAVVAIQNISDNPDEDLWALAKKVDGWGKIHIVERLAETNDPKIKEWLLIDGFKNSVMYEYLAYVCVVGGDLLGALKRDQFEPEFRTSLASLYEALLLGGPAQDIDDYEHAAEVTELYVKKLSNIGEINLDEFVLLHSITDYLDDGDNDWEQLKNNGWNQEIRERIEEDVLTLTPPEIWRNKIKAKLENYNENEFWNLKQAAELLNIDLWDIVVARLVNQPEVQGNWWDLMSRATDSRIDFVIELAQKHIELKSISTGPAEEWGMGDEFTEHMKLDYILQDLDRFPGKGQELIVTGLNSPVVRNRHMAVKALKAWETKQWNDDVVKALRSAIKLEPDSDIRKDMSVLISDNRL